MVTCTAITFHHYPPSGNDYRTRHRFKPMPPRRDSMKGGEGIVKGGEGVATSGYTCTQTPAQGRYVAGIHTVARA